MDASSSLLTAFAAGLLSVLSPCVLPLLPAYLSLVSGISVEELRSEGSADAVRRRVMLASFAFVLGFSAVFVLLGASATLLGRVLRSFRLEVFGLEIGVAQIAGVLIIVMGLHLTGLIQIPLLYREKRFEGPKGPTSLIGAGLVGAAFAFGWTPCVGPILGGILTLAGARETVLEGMGLLTVYSAGLAVPFLLAALERRALPRRAAPAEAITSAPSSSSRARCWSSSGCSSSPISSRASTRTSSSSKRSW